MPSIAELRSRLASAQSRKAKARLSNLQCIDILLKVCRKNNVSLITSNDGMMFYTIEEVQNEVENELMCRGGRIPIFELNSLLNFQPDYVDRAVSNIIAASDRYMNSHGVIISREYIANLMVAVNDRTQECGTVDFADLSKEYDLPLEMIKSYVASNLGTVIKGNVNGNVLESYTFEKRKINNLKVAILATTLPVSTHDMARVVKININMVNDTLQAMLKKGEIRGLLRGGEYLPQCYLDSVESYLSNQYLRNGYVEVKLVKSFSHLDLKGLDKLLPNYLKLDSVYINRDLFQPVSILINEAIAAKSWREVGSMLPAVLTPGDWGLVISNIKNAAKSGALMDNVFVAHAFTEDLTKHLVKTMSERKEKVELFHKTFNDRKLGSDHLAQCVELVLTPEDPYSDSTDHFTDLYQIYPEQVFSLVEEELKKELLALIATASRASRSAVDKKTAKDSTDKLLTHLMESEMSLKALEKVKFEPGNVLSQFMVKELSATIFAILLEYYLTNNKLVEAPVEVDPNNRNKLVELIVDADAKALFKSFVAHLKAKDAPQCVATARDLCKLMYINYNVKKDSRNFVRSKQSQFNQQLNSLTNLDSVACCFVALNLVLLKNNLYLFMTDKLWCLKEVRVLFESVLASSEHFNLIKEVLSLVEELENTGEDERPDTDVKRLQERTSELIAAFKT